MIGELAERAHGVSLRGVDGVVGESRRSGAHESDAVLEQLDLRRRRQAGAVVTGALVAGALVAGALDGALEDCAAALEQLKHYQNWVHMEDIMDAEVYRSFLLRVEAEWRSRFFHPPSTMISQ